MKWLRNSTTIPSTCLYHCNACLLLVLYLSITKSPFLLSIGFSVLFTNQLYNLIWQFWFYFFCFCQCPHFSSFQGNIFVSLIHIPYYSVHSYGCCFSACTLHLTSLIFVFDFLQLWTCSWLSFLSCVSVLLVIFILSLYSFFSVSRKPSLILFLRWHCLSFLLL